MNTVLRVYSFINAHWTMVLGISCIAAVAIPIVIRCTEPEEKKVQRLRRKTQREVQAIAGRISSYGRQIHKRFPTGDVVVGETDLAQELRKDRDIVVTALNVLLGEKKVRKAPLSGYWKLNAD